MVCVYTVIFGRICLLCIVCMCDCAFVTDVRRFLTYLFIHSFIHSSFITPVAADIVPLNVRHCVYML